MYCTLKCVDYIFIVYGESLRTVCVLSSCTPVNIELPRVTTFSMYLYHCVLLCVNIYLELNTV